MEEKKELVEKETPEKKKFNFKKIIDFIKKVPYKPFIILGLLAIVAILIPRRLPSVFEDDDYSRLEKISELATLEAFYHDVAIKEEEASTLGKIFGNIGYYKYWLEFDVIIKIGVDSHKVRIEKPNLRNEVKVYVPEAQVLGEPQVLNQYMKDPITDTGFLTSIDVSDKMNTVGAAVNRLKDSVSKDTELLNQARERAKEFFKNYITSIGKEIGVNYKVVFED